MVGEIFRTCPDRPWGPPSLLYNVYRVFPGGKERLGRDADPSPPSSAVGHEKGRAIHLLALWAVRPVQSLSACTRVHFTFLLSRSQCSRGLRHRSPAVRLMRLWVRIPPGTWMSVCCESCVLSGRCLCDVLITRPEASYRLRCVAVCDLRRNLVNEEAVAHWGLLRSVTNEEALDHWGLLRSVTNVRT